MLERSGECRRGQAQVHGGGGKTCSLGKCAHLLICPSMARHRSPSSMYLAATRMRDGRRAAAAFSADNALHHYIHSFAFGEKVHKFNLQGSASAEAARERRQATG